MKETINTNTPLHLKHRETNLIKNKYSTLLYQQHLT
jgi:hypothetical protein